MREEQLFDYTFFLHQSVQSLSCVRLFATPWTAACQAPLFFTNSQSLLKLMSVKSVMASSHLILCCPLLLLPSIFPNIRVFSSESVLHIRWSKYWSFSFSISPSNEYSGLISFRMDWFDLVAFQGTLKNLLLQICPYRFAFFFFKPSCTAYGISVSRPGIEPRPQHWKPAILTSSLPGNSLACSRHFTQMESYNTCFFFPIGML